MVSFSRYFTVCITYQPRLVLFTYIDDARSNTNQMLFFVAIMENKNVFGCCSTALFWTVFRNELYVSLNCRVCVGIQVPPDENEDWYCRVCIVKKQENIADKKKKSRKKKVVT
jgi:hypothetical protein